MQSTTHAGVRAHDCKALHCLYSSKVILQFNTPVPSSCRSLVAFKQEACFGKTLSEEAKKVLGYLVAKNILGFLCAHENDTFDTLYPPVLTSTFAVLPRALGICHLNKTFH